MKLCDFLKRDISIDVASSLTDDWVIAFIGPLNLTEEGKIKFGPILENEVDMDADNALIFVNTDEEDDLARALFYSAAGYCTVADFDRWFEDE